MGQTHVSHERASVRRRRASLARSVSVALSVSKFWPRRKGAALRSPSRSMLLLLCTAARLLCTQTRMKRIAREREREGEGGKRAHISNLQSNIIRRPPVGSLPPSCSPLPTCKNDTMDTREAETERRPAPTTHGSGRGRLTALSILTSICTKSELDRPIRLLFSPPLPIVSDSWMSREWENEDEGREGKEGSLENEFDSAPFQIEPPFYPRPTVTVIPSVPALR